jgi:hypothetical protein
MIIKLALLVSTVFFTILSIAGPAGATQIDLLFDVKLNRIYSYDGTPLSGVSIGDMSTMKISFNNEISSKHESVNPWGPGTSRLFTYLNGPTLIESPFTQYVPTNPFPNPIPTAFSAAGVTANERLSIGDGAMWYEDLWFANQYSQFSQSVTDGLDAYRYKLNVHWNMTRYDFTPDKLYYFEEADLLSLLNRSISDGITFSISEDAYIDFSDGNFFGYDLYGTATLREFKMATPVPAPTSFLLFGIGLLGLAGISRRKQ